MNKHLNRSEIVISQNSPMVITFNGFNMIFIRESHDVKLLKKVIFRIKLRFGSFVTLRIFNLQTV